LRYFVVDETGSTAGKCHGDRPASSGFPSLFMCDNTKEEGYDMKCYWIDDGEDGVGICGTSELNVIKKEISVHKAVHAFGLY
jgi:hypothetical protein